MAYDKEVEKIVRANGKTYKRKNAEILKVDVDTEHYYYIAGEGFYPSVTGIIGEAGPVGFGLRYFWKQNTAEDSDKILKTAGDFGSKMHDVYERLLAGIKINALEENFDTPAHKSVTSFVDWFNLVKPTQYLSEQVVASTNYKYAGTLDFIGYIQRKDAADALGLKNAKKEAFIDGKPGKKELWLIDFKTSNSLQYGHELQGVAYKQAVYESLGLNVDRVGLLRLGTKHKAGYEFKEDTRQISEFMNVYNTYISMHNGVIPEPSEIVNYPNEYQLIEEVKNDKVSKS